MNNQCNGYLQALQCIGLEGTKSMMEKSHNIIVLGKERNGRQATALICKVCGNEEQAMLQETRLRQTTWKEYLFHVITVICLLVQDLI